MMMTGRVLLVCAFCVLWCGAGGAYARDLDKNAQGVCIASGVVVKNCYQMPSGCDKNTITAPLRSALPITVVEASTENNVSVPTDGNQDSTSDINPGVVVGTDGEGTVQAGGSKTAGDSKGGGGAGSSGSSKGSEGLDLEPLPSGGGGTGDSPPSPPTDVTSSTCSGGGMDSPGNALSSVENKIPEEVQPEKAAKAALPQHPASQDQETMKSAPGTQSQTPSLAAGQDVGDVATGGEGQGSSREKTKENEDLKAPGTEVILESPDPKLNGTGGNESEVPNAALQETKTQNQGKTLEKENNDSQSGGANKNSSNEHERNDTREGSSKAPTSTAGTAQSTSTGSQEQAAASSSDGNPTPAQEETFTVKKRTENTQPPDAAGTGKPSSGDKANIANSDSSTAVSHTTSPLLLLLACAAAAAVVAA
ncbi:mucin-associated surface protein (MASP) [Trypanosoma cruzi Dm28c]|uniref:Mucin-associated surface protein (MASP) n=2 Tax=Trypanosoma cruzi TaxID=5693 RepID=V5B8P4_TRYCR|nr:mucin-associated surface protein (MASP) [Trypanosoma cruzi Dm28c]PBJ77023.1 mucin-associated surface protein [Trypanosoma cruzi cruzi]PWU90487.1 Mucin-associated surface protein (MASP) [Trypanosoma cruzi]